MDIKELYIDPNAKDVIDVPKSPDSKPMFLLTCPKFKFELDKAKKRLAEELVQQLKDWLVVAGAPK